MKKRITIYGALGVLLICMATVFSCKQDETIVMPPPPVIEQVVPETVMSVADAEMAITPSIVENAVEVQPIDVDPLPTSNPAVVIIEPTQPEVK